MCLAITKKGKICKKKNCAIHNQEIHTILASARELMYLELGNWTGNKLYTDGYMQLTLWLLTKYSVQ